MTVGVEIVDLYGSSYDLASSYFNLLGRSIRVQWLPDSVFSMTELFAGLRFRSAGSIEASSFTAALGPVFSVYPSRRAKLVGSDRTIVWDPSGLVTHGFLLAVGVDVHLIEHLQAALELRYRQFMVAAPLHNAPETFSARVGGVYYLAF